MSEAGPWWAELYDDAVADVFLRRGDGAEVTATADYLWRTLELAPGARVFDQCCGIGSLAAPLSQRGAFVIGVDQSAGYVARAQAAAAGLPCHFVAGDAFRFVPEQPCDGGFNWGTGFGNAAEDERNVHMLQRAFAALRPGGRFVLDYQHIARVLLEFQPALVQRGLAVGEEGKTEVLILRESSLDLLRGVLVQRWTVLHPSGPRREVRSEVRLYLPHELERLLHAAGFREVMFHGDLDGGPLHPRSPRCLAVARRPA
jgi:SAM-dependent methyltransferase